MPKTKAKTSTKTNKQDQQSIRYLCNVILILAVIVGIGFIAIAIGRFCNKTGLSRLEQRELEAFESIFQSEVSSQKLNDTDQNTAVQLVNIGLSQDDDLYGDLIIYYYNDDHETVATQKGKVYLQCDHEYRKPITNGDEKSCGFAYSYEEKIPANN